jgi:hypothetical protein
MDPSPKRSVTALPGWGAFPFSETSTHSLSRRVSTTTVGWSRAVAQAAVHIATANSMPAMTTRLMCIAFSLCDAVNQIDLDLV